MRFDQVAIGGKFFATTGGESFWAFEKKSLSSAYYLSGNPLERSVSTEKFSKSATVYPLT
jgi:hypothetical protein